MSTHREDAVMYFINGAYIGTFEFVASNAAAEKPVVRNIIDSPRIQQRIIRAQAVEFEVVKP